ncbi:tetracycline 6-hydroxylase protein [Thozetella sp. PMI_491]|nr:tetracycline 6-hydroxylase protein [Thozetella sp. PMI_491]
MSETIYDVVIAGAGPVGLVLASELRLANINVLVLEAAKDPEHFMKRHPFGARGLTPAIAEALEYRGMLAEILKDNPVKMPPVPGAQPGRLGGHFAGIAFEYDKIDTSKWDYRLPGPFESYLLVEMEHLEKALARHAIANGVEIRRGISVQGFDQSDDMVTIRAGDQTFRARWLVGCDGGRSSVRKATGIEFVGTDPELTGYSAQIVLANPEVLAPGKNNTPFGMFQMHPGHLIMADFDGGKYHRSESLALEHVQAVLRRISSTDVTIQSIDAISTWTDRAAQAATYRKGRVLLAGDAAHIHSPLGGQGLNLGFGDALNLSWKLAATIHGWAPESLLDTYSEERHRVGERVLDWSRAQVALIKPSPASRAMHAILRDVIATGDGATYFTERVWGVTTRYNLGDDSQHPLVGRMVPNFELVDGKTTLSDLFREHKGFLLDFNSSPKLQEMSKRWSERLQYVMGEAKEQLGLGSLLVRPDGIVAWACDKGEPNLDEVTAAASRWFGCEKQV